MLERYMDILPELAKDRDRFGVYANDIKLSKYELNEQLFLINFVLDKIRYSYNAPFMFGKTVTQASETMESWRVCLGVIYPSWIINGLHRLLSGEVSRYVDFPPRHAIAFNGICRECTPISERVALEYNKPPEDELPFEEENRIRKADHFLKLMRSSVIPNYNKVVDDIANNAVP